MTLAEYIETLQKIGAEHGMDLLVYQYDFRGGRSLVSAPEVAYAKILAPRESMPRFWRKYEPMDRCGEKVVHA